MNGQERYDDMVLYVAVNNGALADIILHKCVHNKEEDVVVLLNESFKKESHQIQAEKLKARGIVKDIFFCQLWCDRTQKLNRQEYEQYIVDYYKKILSRCNYSINDFQDIYIINDFSDGAGMNIYLNIIDKKYYTLRLDSTTIFIEIQQLERNNYKYYVEMEEYYKAYSIFSPCAIPILLKGLSQEIYDRVLCKKNIYNYWDRDEDLLKISEEDFSKLIESYDIPEFINGRTLLASDGYHYMMYTHAFKYFEKFSLGYGYLSEEEISSLILLKLTDYYVDTPIYWKAHPNFPIDQELINKLYDEDFQSAGNCPLQFFFLYCKKNNIKFSKYIGISSSSKKLAKYDSIFEEKLILEHSYLELYYIYDSILISLMIANKNNAQVCCDKDILCQANFIKNSCQLHSDISLRVVDYNKRNNIGKDNVILVDCVNLRDNTPGELERIINNFGKNTNIIFLNLQNTNLFFNNTITNRILSVNLHKDVTNFDKTGYFHDEVIYAYCGTYDFYRKLRTFTHERVMKHQGYTLRVSVSDAMYELNNRALLLAKPKEIKVPAATPAKKPESKPVIPPQPKDNLRELLHNFITARIDISLSGSNAKLEILNISDKNISHTQPNWFNKNGNGHILESSAFKIDFEIKAVTSGDLNIQFRGVDVRESVNNTIRVPYWIDYKSIKVDGKELLKQIIPTWHDQILPLNGKVNAGDTIKLHVEWEPHKDTRKNIAI